MSIKAQLAMAKKNWKQIKDKADAGGFGNVFEDGVYKANITKAELQESKSSGRLQIMLEYEFLDGEYIGKKKYDYLGFDSVDNQARVLAFLLKFGIEVENPEDIESALEKLVKTRVPIKISLKTKGEFQNVRLEKVLNGEEAEEGTEEEGGEAVPSGEEMATVLEEGMKVSFELKGKEVEGKVVEVLEEEGNVRVEVDGKVYRIKVEKLTLLEEVPEEPAEEPAEEPEAEPGKKVVKKTGKLAEGKKK